MTVTTGNKDVVGCFKLQIYSEVFSFHKVRTQTHITGLGDSEKMLKVTQRSQRLFPLGFKVERQFDNTTGVNANTSSFH